MVSKKIKERLSKIHLLENRLIKLKRDLINTTSLASLRQKEQDRLTFVILQIRDQLIAIPIKFVIEIVQMVELIPLSESMGGVSGLLNYHGEIMVVIDIGELMGLPKCSISADNSLSICHLESFRFAILADEILDLVSVTTKDVKVEEELMAGSLNAIGIVRSEGRTSMIIDLWSIIAYIQSKIHQSNDIGYFEDILEQKTQEEQ